MANLAVSNTFSNGTTADAPQVNTNFSDIVTYVNNRNGGGTAWDALTVSGATSLQSTLAVTGVATFSAAIKTAGTPSTLFGYRRPNLVYSSATAVNVENNTGTSNQTTIIFPDGDIRSVTEDVSSTHKYRQFLITATAEFTSGTEDSGLYSGLSEAANTWYAIYAVKSQIDSTKFVLVGTTTLPLQANFATLNSNLGTSSWVYLGLIRNGDGAAATGDILNFAHSGACTVFRNATSALEPGIRLAAATDTSVAYTYSAGTGAGTIPDHIKLGIITAYAQQTLTLSNTTTSAVYSIASDTGTNSSQCIAVLPDGLTNAGDSAVRRITLSGFIDPLLEGSYQIL